MVQSVYNVISLSKAQWLEELEQYTHFVLVEAVFNPDEVMAHAEEYLHDTELYWGESAERHASISPYLFPIRDWGFVEQEFANVPHWGMVISLPLEQRHQTYAKQSQKILHHLRQWMLVHRYGENQILRISDWDILKTLLDASTDAEALTILGPIESFTYWEPESDSVSVIQRTVPVPAMSVFQSPRILSEAQDQALERRAQQSIYQDYAAHMRTHHAECREWQEDIMTDFIHQNVLQARSLGLGIEQDLVRYLSLAILMGNEFYLQDWARPILAQTEYIGDTNRMDRLIKAAIAQMDAAEQDKKDV